MSLYGAYKLMVTEKIILSYTYLRRIVYILQNFYSNVSIVEITF